ncbi:MAG: ACT domain-containing protein [Gemmatimonadales bacterium]
MRLRVLPLDLAVARLDPLGPIPAWAHLGPFFSVSRTGQELSVVCARDKVPPAIQQEGPFRAFEVEGPLDFYLTGILSTLLTIFAEARISIFAISTFDTDYVLVKREDVEAAAAALRAAGHEILVQ